MAGAEDYQTFIQRLEAYTKVQPLTTEMSPIALQILVEVLLILEITTKDNSWPNEAVSKLIQLQERRRLRGVGARHQFFVVDSPKGSQSYVKLPHRRLRLVLVVYIDLWDYPTLRPSTSTHTIPCYPSIELYSQNAK